MLFQNLKTNGKRKRPLKDVMDSLSSFISTKMQAVLYMYIAFGQKLGHKEWNLLCNKILL